MPEILKLDDPKVVDALEERPADEPVLQLVAVDQEDVNLLRQIAEEDGLQVELSLEPEFVIETGLLVIGIIGGAGAVAGAINYGREKRRGGQVIDLTKTSDEERFRRVKGLQYGLV